MDFEFSEPPAEAPEPHSVRQYDHEEFAPQPEPDRAPAMAPARPAATVPSMNHGPSAVEKELYLLSACMKPDTDTRAQCEAAGVTPQLFYDTRNQAVFAAIQHVWKESPGAEDHAVFAALQQSKVLDSIGGIPYFGQIGSVAPTGLHVKAYIKDLMDLAAKRSAIRLCAEAIERLNDQASTAAEVLPEIQSQFDHIANNQGPAGDSLVTAYDLCCTNPPPKPPEVLHGLLREGAVMIMSGPSKSRKTYTALSLACAVALGYDWLNFKTTRGAVIYLNLELGTYSAKERLAAIAQSLGVEPPKNLHLFNARGAGLKATLDWFRRWLPKVIKKTGARLIVIDPLYKISSASGVEENSNNEIGAFLYELEMICQRCGGVSLVIAHHFAKGNQAAKNAIDRSAGAGTLARSPDVIMSMTELKEDSEMTFGFALRDFAPVPDIGVRWNYPRWEVDGTIDTKALKEPGGRTDAHPAEKALEVLGDNKLTKKEWMQRTGWQRDTFNRKLGKLVESGKVKFVGGLYSARVEGDESESEPEPTSATELRPHDFIAKFSAHFKGREKRTDAGPLKRAADGVQGPLGKKEWRQLLAECVATGVLNKDPEDGRYFVP